ncbi:MAG: SPFH domain-containing protein [Candidatus Nanoarchaeia archaeon]|nr:SPFH domain-containing protein [Candidatus Nanoarchaeia archaeon]
MCGFVLFLAVILILSTSFVVIGANETGHLIKVFGFTSLPEGKIIAANGEKGKQARIIPPGFHFEFLLNVLYRVEKKQDIVVPPGYCGKITALDGEPLPEGEVYAPEWAAENFANMLKAEYFLNNQGKKGPQISVIKPGTQKINQYLFEVDVKQKVTTVEQGFVGVVKSNAQQVLYIQEEVNKLNMRTTENLASLVVPRGYRGVWKEVLPAGQYYLNSDVFTVIPIDTRVQTWEYSGGFLRRYIDLKVDQNGSIIQTERQEQIPIPEGAADRAITVRIEGWEIPLDSRILIQVDPEKAPYVVASVGNIDEVENDIITPTYRSILRNVCGSEDRKALELIYNRENLESMVETRVKPEGDKAYITIKEIRFGEPAYPPELMVARLREQLAEQLNKTFQEEKKAQDQRIETEKARAQADQQPTLIEAQIKKQAADFEKDAAKLKGEGEKLRLTEIAIGQKAQVEVLGEDRVMQLAMLKEILETAKANPEIVKVPYILVQGQNGGLEGAAAILGASNLSPVLLGQQSKKADSPTAPAEIKK